MRAKVKTVALIPLCVLLSINHRDTRTHTQKLVVGYLIEEEGGGGGAGGTAAKPEGKDARAPPKEAATASGASSASGSSASSVGSSKSSGSKQFAMGPPPLPLAAPRRVPVGEALMGREGEGEEGEGDEEEGFEDAMEEDDGGGCGR